MKATSARTLLFLSFLLTLLSGLGMAPSGALFAALLAALFAAIPLLAAPGRLRLVAVLLLLLALAAAYLQYPGFKEHMARYRQHVETRP